MSLLREDANQMFWMTENAVCDDLLLVPRAQFIFIEVSRVHEALYGLLLLDVSLIIAIVIVVILAAMVCLTPSTLRGLVRVYRRRRPRATTEET